MGTAERLVDTTFGINHQILALLGFLTSREPDFAEFVGQSYDVYFETAPWYNGRERGIVLTMVPDRYGMNNPLHIAVFEHRNSDGICLVKWESKHGYLNPPTLHDVPKEAYPTKWDVAASFGYGEIDKVADYIYNEMEKHYKIYHKAEKEAKT